VGFYVPGMEVAVPGVQTSGLPSRSLAAPPTVLAGLRHISCKSQVFCMHFVIVYHTNAEEVGRAPWAGALEDTVRVARDGLLRHNADRFIIFDDRGQVVATGQRPA
jgi:hypothetical protein